MVEILYWYCIKIKVLILHTTSLVDVCNRFACLSSSWAHPWWLCWSVVMSNCPDISHEDSSFCSGSIPTSMIFNLLFIPFPELSATITSLISMQFPLPLWIDRELLLSSSSLPSSATSSGVYEAVIPLSLKDLICFIFNNLQLACCNLHSMAALFSDSVKDIFLPWVALYLV